ncbi:MAG: hypothetical protein CVU39_22985 [Chloroflexi bacterium HGW-Chloroflexi-10]|nr:MAG: hypothetical protein CVU39_22985 [Chloroflexi bacterium HGW-Chloroflexi-10]
MQLNFSGLVLLIFIAGVFGGSVNYFTEKKEKSGFKLWFNRALIGVAGSFLMPLFLETISSDLVHSVLSKTDNNSEDIFVLFGFCLLGAISSKVLMRTLSEKILQEAKEAKETALKASEDVAELKTEVGPIVDQATEQEEISDSKIVNSKPLVDFDLETISILKALNNSKFSLRSKTGIAQDTKLTIDVITAKLNILKNNALASEINGKKGIRWAITSKGYELYREYDNNTKQN